MDHAHPPPVSVWRCPNCGQTHFGDQPPDTCDFCRDMTTWQPVVAAASAPPEIPRRPTTADPPYTQMRLFDDES